MLCLSFQTADETANMARTTGIAFSACDAVLIVSVFIQRSGRCDVLDPAGCCEASETAGIGTGYRDADIFQIHILHRTHVSSDESRFLAS